jgi:hypothetical protein
LAVTELAGTELAGTELAFATVAVRGLPHRGQKSPAPAGAPHAEQKLEVVGSAGMVTVGSPAR